MAGRTATTSLVQGCPQYKAASGPMPARRSRASSPAWPVPRLGEQGLKTSAVRVSKTHAWIHDGRRNPVPAGGEGREGGDRKARSPGLGTTQSPGHCQEQPQPLPDSLPRPLSSQKVQRDQGPEKWPAGGLGSTPSTTQTRRFQEQRLSLKRRLSTLGSDPPLAPHLGLADNRPCQVKRTRSPPGAPLCPSTSAAALALLGVFRRKHHPGDLGDP